MHLRFHLNLPTWAMDARAYVWVVSLPKMARSSSKARCSTVGAVIGPSHLTAWSCARGRGRAKARWGGVVAAIRLWRSWRGWARPPCVSAPCGSPRPTAKLPSPCLLRNTGDHSRSARRIDTRAVPAGPSSPGDAPDLLDVGQAAGSAAHSVPRATVGWLGCFLLLWLAGSSIACSWPSPARGVALQRHGPT